MNTARILLVCILVLAVKSFGQSNTNPDTIIGYWMTGEGKAKVQIFRVGKKYFGKIVWLKAPKETDGSIKLDKHNPDETLRSKPVVGLTILRDFVWDADDMEFDDGRIYDPESGSDYSCYMKFETKDKLYVRGYVGFSLIGRTQYWTRTN
jgi:uncharacterized protein (DUF2147 family)